MAVLFSNQTPLFGIFAELLYSLLHPLMVHCCGSDADGESGFTAGRTPRPLASLQHKEVSKGWLFGLSSEYLVLVLRLPSGAVSHRGVCQPSLVLWVSTLDTLYPVTEGPVERQHRLWAGTAQH